MPTLIDLDSFVHQKLDVAQSGSGFIGVYDAVASSSGITFDAANKRTADHTVAMKMVMPTAATRVTRNIAAGNRLIVGSVYFRVTATPSVQSDVVHVATALPSSIPIEMKTDGKLTCGATSAGTTANSYADSNWHLLDYKIDTSANPHTIDFKVDGADATSGTSAGSASDLTLYALGTHANDTLTVWYQDWVISVTSGDYPIGHHICKALWPTGEGTDSLGGTITDAGAGTTNLYQSVDDWNGSTPDTATYVTQNATGASNYAEFTFADPSESTIWDVHGIIAGFASSTSASATKTTKTQIVDSSNADIDTIDNAIDYSGSTTVLGYYRHLLARPSGGWDGTKLTGTKARWGYSTIGSSRLPRLSAVMLEYAAPWSGTQTITLGLVTETDSALDPTTVKRRTLGLVTETDATSAFGRSKIGHLGLVSETDIPLALVPLAHIIVLGLVTETDSVPGSLSISKLLELGLVTETDVAQAFTVVKQLALGLVEETDEAFVLSKTKIRELGLAQEWDHAIRLDVDTFLRRAGGPDGVKVSSSVAAALLAAVMLRDYPATNASLAQGAFTEVLLEERVTG